MSKVVLVTGGSSGIGKSICDHLSGQGFIVYGTSRNPDSLNTPELPYTLLKLDVVDEENAKQVVKSIVDREGKIDVLINNAGVGITGPVEETPNSEIQKAFNTNFFGPINLMKAAMPYMRDQRKGLIINITSIAGYMGLPYRGIYCATKGALALVSESMQLEAHEFGIDICNLAPGDFNTNIASGRYHAPILEDSAYSRNYEQVLYVVNKQMDDAEDPAQMGIVVEKIIRKKNRKMHYRVGAFMEKFSIRLKQILPDKVFNKLLLNHYKL
ncbi:SDR family oxidoreductase [Robertkochia solimangrovi]|uniref:SDR family oxidoreductase n=1 Tax=Robertkochia solimangrovi TaxID=2213046 RepID=UPI00117F26F4|nr:SDR family oxidoreductase [Robertkochia solimangrovi]TRZ45182.1 short-chain dehydrogenase/reductase [Robertkochia solimangrovi]